MKMRTDRRWKKSVVQFGEDELISFMKRTIQGVFVRHHDRTRAISHITKSGIVQGKSWARQTLSDAWESTSWESLFDNPFRTVITETKLAIEDQPRMWVKEPLEVECRNSASCMRILKLTDTLEVVRDTRCLLRMEKRQSHMMMNAERESERSLREP